MHHSLSIALPGRQAGEKLGLTLGNGATVTALTLGAFGDQAGLRQGDTIEAIDGIVTAGLRKTEVAQMISASPERARMLRVRRAWGGDDAAETVADERFADIRKLWGNGASYLGNLLTPNNSKSASSADSAAGASAARHQLDDDDDGDDDEDEDEDEDEDDEAEEADKDKDDVDEDVDENGAGHENGSAVTPSSPAEGYVEALPPVAGTATGQQAPPSITANAIKPRGVTTVDSKAGEPRHNSGVHTTPMPSKMRALQLTASGEAHHADLCAPRFDAEDCPSGALVRFLVGGVSSGRRADPSNMAGLAVCKVLAVGVDVRGLVSCGERIVLSAAALRAPRARLIDAGVHESAAQHVQHIGCFAEYMLIPQVCVHCCTRARELALWARM